MAVAKKTTSFADQYEEIIANREEVADSPEEHFEKRLRAAGLSDEPVKKQVESVSVVESKPGASPVKRSARLESMMSRYAIAIQKLGPAGISVLKFLYLGDYHPAQLSSALISNKVDMQREKVRRTVYLLRDLGLIIFPGFPPGRNNALVIKLLPSMKTFLLENNI